MAKLGATYGSERQFLEYRRQASEVLDTAVLDALGQPPERAIIEWHYPKSDGRRGTEPTGLDFLELDPSPAAAKALSAWKSAWPRRGTPPQWDGVGRFSMKGQEPRWLLFEAKANHPEFTGAPCRASDNSRETIVKTLGKTKVRWNVHRDFDWTGSYYQHANRLAIMATLEKYGIAANLVEIYFCGERFPDGRTCPATADEWHPLLEARRLTLGLLEPDKESVVAHVFLPALTLTPAATE